MDVDLNPILTIIVMTAIKIVIALIIFAIGRWLANMTAKWVRRTLDMRETDEAVARMLTTLARFAVLLAAFVFALAAVGIQTTALAALIGALGLAIGLALQGALGNFASGVLILTFHPFRIGDLVDIAGETGMVEDIQLVSTVLDKFNGSKVIIPNGQVGSSVITNYSTTGLRRVDLVFGISYDDDLVQAKKVLTELVESHDLILAEPQPVIRVLELGDSSVNIAVRPFVELADYWTVYFDLTEQAKLRFDKVGLSMPYPQRDVHLVQDSETLEEVDES